MYKKYALEKTLELPTPYLFFISGLLLDFYIYFPN